MAFYLGDKISGVRELKLGQSFDKSCKDEAFHTIRYDFKPASVNSHKAGNLNIADKEVTLTVPLVASGGTAQEAVFKGNKTPASKDCLLIIDNKTGEIVLEKISENIRVKKTRAEGSSKKSMQSLTTDPTPKKRTNPNHAVPTTTANSSNGASAAQRSSANHSKGSSGNMQVSGVSTPNSMPLLGFEDKIDAKSDSSSDSDSNSDSSSSSSDSDSDTDSQEKSESKNQTFQNVQNQWEDKSKHQKTRSILSDLELSEED